MAQCEVGAAQFPSQECWRLGKENAPQVPWQVKAVTLELEMELPGERLA